MPEKIPPYNIPNESLYAQVLASKIFGEIKKHADSPRQFNQYTNERLERMKIADEEKKAGILRCLEKIKDDYLKSPEGQKIVVSRETLKDAGRFEKWDKKSNPEKD